MIAPNGIFRIVVEVEDDGEWTHVLHHNQFAYGFLARKDVSGDDWLADFYIDDVKKILELLPEEILEGVVELIVECKYHDTSHWTDCGYEYDGEMEYEIKNWRRVEGEDLKYFKEIFCEPEEEQEQEQEEQAGEVI